MAKSEEPEIHATILEQHGVDTRSLEFRTVADQIGALKTDVQRIRSYPLIRKGVSVAGAIYDVANGSITPVDC
jgi:carbonic anhydrase